MERIRFIEHRGKRILLIDYSGIRRTDEAIATIEHVRAFVARQPPRSLLLLSDVKDTHYNSAVLQKMKELAAANEPFVKASAVVGMSGLHRIAYQGVILLTRRKVQTFDTRDEAMDWLAEQP